MPDGAVMPEFYDMVRETEAATNKFGRRPRFDSHFENKQSTMPDAEAPSRTAFEAHRTERISDIGVLGPS